MDAATLPAAWATCLVLLTVPLEVNMTRAGSKGLPQHWSAWWPLSKCAFKGKWHIFSFTSLILSVLPKPGLTGHPKDSNCLRGGHATGERLPSMQMVVICNSIAVQQAEQPPPKEEQSMPQERGVSVLQPFKFGLCRGCLWSEHHQSLARLNSTQRILSCGKSARLPLGGWSYGVTPLWRIQPCLSSSSSVKW